MAGDWRVGAFLVYRDWSSNHALLWAHWPLMGWGIGLALHGWQTLRRPRVEVAASGPVTYDVEMSSFGERYGTYLVMSAVFVAMDLMLSGRLTWAHYPILGWGNGILLARMGRANRHRS